MSHQNALGMWNALQGAAGNLANRASRLAVEVLDAGPPEHLKSHEDLRNGQEQKETAGVLVTDRLSALKARYKTGTTDGTPRHSREATSEDGAGTEEGTDVVRSSFEEGSEIGKLREQLERLKGEMLRQAMTADEALKQQRYEWSEKMKQLQDQHQNQMRNSREEITRHFQEQLESKDRELAAAKESGVSGLGERHEGDDFQMELAQKRQEIESLKQQILDVQQKEINDAFGIRQESKTDDSEFVQLQNDYEELMIKCHNLEEINAGMVSAEQLTERDAFWQAEMKRMEASHAEAMRLQTQQQSQMDPSEDLALLKSETEEIRRLWNQDKSEKEMISKEKNKLEEEVGRIQHALEDRDAVWQQELISSQNEQQELRKQYESTKRELLEEKEQHDRVRKAFEESESELQNEFELRNAAQAHVRSLQKSMLDIDSGASSVKQQLVDARAQIEQLKESYEQRFQKETTALSAQLSTLQEQNQYQQKTLQSLNQRLEQTEHEKLTLQEEVTKLTVRDEGQKEAADVTKLTYDLEAAAESLKLAESRNSILGHEVDALTQELEQIKQGTMQDTSTGMADVQGDVHVQLKKAESERDNCKEQLKRLKQQMIQMEDDQEASLHWRIDAEVKLALEDFKRKSQADGGASKQELSALQLELGSVRELVEQYKSQIEQKDIEMQNLQIALGELTYHGEAADKLRRDLRSAQEQIQTLRNEILDLQATSAEANSARKAAESSADEAHRQMTELEDKVRQTEGNLFSVKKQLLDVSQKLRRMGNDEGTMVDRRLVVQLLVAYLEKKHEKDALEVMARVLGFTEEEKHKVGVSSSGRGLLGSVAGGTLALVKGGMSVATFGLLNRGLNSETGSKLADEWVDFLTKDADPLSNEDPLTYLQKGGTPKYRRSGIDERASTKPAASEGWASTHTIPRYDDFVGDKHSQTDASQSNSGLPFSRIHGTLPPFERPPSDLP